MGQKCNPTGLRIGINKNWDSRWYASKSKFADTLVEDHNLREFLLKELKTAGVPKVEIERTPRRIRINIHCAKPGVVIGKQGAQIEKLKEICAKKLSVDPNRLNIQILEIKNPDLNSVLVAQKVASQLEARVSFRRAVKTAIRDTMRLGARGIKIQVSGRIGGAEIARKETYKEGTIPLQTIRADIDYGTAEAATTYGRIGVKVWIYQGEILHESRNTNRRNDRRSGNFRRGDSDGRDNRRRSGRNDRRSRNSSSGDRDRRRTSRPRQNAANTAKAEKPAAPKTEGGNE